MKRYLILIGIVAILTSGCVNKQINSAENVNSIDESLEKLAVLYMNNNIEKMTEVANELYSKNVIILENIKIDIQGATRQYINNKYSANTTNESKCVFIKYLLNGENKQYNYCK